MDRNALYLLPFYLVLTLTACSGVDRGEDDDDDDGAADGDTDTDGDGDSDADTDTGSPSCVEGQTVCLGDEVWECDASGEAARSVLVIAASQTRKQSCLERFNFSGVGCLNIGGQCLCLGVTNSQ